jgi:hypothetical protein
MKNTLPILQLSKIVCPEDLSPRSEELREGIETKQSPFLFQTNRTHSHDWKNSPLTSPEKDPYVRVVELQKKEIVQLKEQNREIQKKVENFERELKGLKRLRILLREKDRRIKELQDSLVSVNKVSSCDLKKIEEKVVHSWQFYKEKPPRRTWSNPVPKVLNGLLRIKKVVKDAGLTDCELSL